MAKLENSFCLQYTALKADLPKNVQILTLEPWKGTHFLLRLEHILEGNDDDSASTPVTVNLNVSATCLFTVFLYYFDICKCYDTWIT